MSSAAVSRRSRSVVFRVMLSYAGVALAFALVATWSVLAQQRAAREAEAMRSSYLPLALALRDAVASQDTFNSQLNHITTALNPADKRVWFDTALSLGRPGVFRALREMLTHAFVDGDAELRRVGDQLLVETNGIERFLEADRELLSKLFSALAANEMNRAEQLRDELVTRGLQARRGLSTLEETVGSNLDALLAGARVREQLALRILIGSAALTALVGLAMALYARRVLKPLGRVTLRAQAVARGDLTERQPIATTDEIGELSATFEAMVGAIARANAELLTAERLATIGKMAAQITHEVRNPLSSMALNVELLEEQVGDDREAKALVSAIKNEIDRLTELSERYLSVARRSRPQLEEEDLVEIARGVLTSLQPDLLKHDITATLVADRAVRCWIDEGQVRQVIINLVRNAREAVGSGGLIEVTIGLAEGQAELWIDDNGQGLDPSVREHLFEPFFTTKKHGTGLGLAITREIIEAHAGRIRCESRAPRGTRFVISLPLKPPAPGPASPSDIH
jgi:signal transduction histidine kinase